VHTGNWWGDLREKRPLGRLRCRWESNIKLDLQEVEGEDMDWIDMVQGGDMWPGVLNSIKNINFHKMRGISLTSCVPVSFSGSNLLH